MDIPIKLAQALGFMAALQESETNFIDKRD